MYRIQTRYLVLSLSILMVFCGLTIAGLIQSNFGTVATTEIDIQTSEKVIIHTTLQVPSGASEANPMPGVVVIHGVIQSKEWLSSFGIELSRRGFVVLTIDARAHGNSGFGGSDAGGVAALEYLDSLNYVSKLGIIGHSMGAGIAIQAISDSSVTVNSLVLVEGGTGGTWANHTYPNNMLVTLGQYSHSFSSINHTALSETFGTTSQVVPGQLYGDFNSGTARKLIIAPTDHLFSTVDLVILSETVEWLKNSLKGTGIDSYWIPKENLVYPFHILGGFIACLGILLSIIPILKMIMELTFFKKLKQSPSSSYSASAQTYWGLGLLYGIISLATFIPLLAIGAFIPFPQSTGAPVGIWLLGSSLIAASILYVVYRYKRNKGEELEWTDFGIDISDHKLFLNTFGMSALLALLVTLWLYCWTLPVDLLLALDFRAFLPLFNDLTPIRLLIAPIYLIFTIPLFFVDGMWLMGLLRTSPKETRIQTQIYWTLKAVFIKCSPFFFILLVQVVMSFILGTALITGMIGFSLLFLWMFAPMYVVTTVLSTWCYRLTDRIYVGTALNAFIFSWILASILPLVI
ncbi:MAG: alpha/beta hydrolase [Candidatus Hodarchaeota archaeon]